jgi:hypothetical protein
MPLKWAQVHDILNKFHKDCFRHSKVDMGGRTDTQAALRSHNITFVF